MLIDRHPAQKGKSTLVLQLGSHHDLRPCDIPSNKVIALYRRPGGRSSNSPTPSEHVVKFLFRQRAGIRINQVPLSATVEPDRIGFPQELHESFAIRHISIIGMKHMHVLDTEL